MDHKYSGSVGKGIKNINEVVRLWEDGIHGEAATDAAKGVSSAISIRVMQSAEETPIQL